jgi:flagellar hook-basal body complex protein FliE
MVTTMSAVNAYNNQLKLAKNAGQTQDASEQSGGSSFADMLSGQLDDVVKTQNVAEAAKIDAINGKGDVTDLVTAIANAELALNTIVTIRDRAISAYQDIIRMPI